MIIVKVKNKKLAFMIPVPYSVLRMGSGILTSNIIQRKMRDWLYQQEQHMSWHSSPKPEFDWDSSRFGIELVLSTLQNRNTKQAIRQLINELQRCKGTVLVDVQAQDGTEVLIIL
jgi:hypothetical protein